MKIPVIFVNGSLGAVCGEDLDELLDKKVIVAFQRSSGLAVIGKDEVRSNRSNGNGSWRDRKNLNVRENIILVSQRKMLPSSSVFEIIKTGRELALPEKNRRASNSR